MREDNAGSLTDPGWPDNVVHTPSSTGKWHSAWSFFKEGTLSLLVDTNFKANSNMLFLCQAESNVVLWSAQRNTAAHSVLPPQIPALPTQVAQQLLPKPLDGPHLGICRDWHAVPYQSCPSNSEAGVRPIIRFLFLNFGSENKVEIPLWRPGWRPFPSISSLTWQNHHPRTWVHG